MLGTQYVKLGKIGHGSYSQVYLCQKANSPIHVCKVMSKDRNKQVRYENEVESLKRLKYCSMVTHYIDNFEDKENYYIVQEYCEGGALKEGRIYSETHASNIVYNTLCALDYVHSAGIVHRDVKIGNIFVHENKIKLGDFGLSYFFDNHGLFHTRELVGTPMYMAPEMLNRECGPKTDIWGVGVVAYYLLSTMFPFDDKENSFKELCKSIMKDEPRFTNRVWKDVSPKGIEFIRRCLTKSYDDRYDVKSALADKWFE